MKRELLLCATLTGAVLAISLQRTPLSPAEAARTPADLFGYEMRPVLHANAPAPTADSLSESEVLRRLGHLFHLQSGFLEAQSEGAYARAHRLLDEAVDELGQLAQHPGMADRPRFRALYRSLTAEYEATYGVPATLDLPRGEIYDVRRDLFAAVDSAGPLLLEDVYAMDVQAMDTEVPITINEKVKASMAKLLQRPHRYLYPWIRRSATYFPMIEHVLAEEDLPDELKYLALVESGLNPHALSRAQAAGFWQFIAPTARRYGLSVNPWVDERLDPEKSTRAAAHHLRDLYEMFGDWHLALAGYNCNPLVVKRAVQRARRQLGREPTFWDIYDDIPEETRHYVPAFIATALIVSNPGAFDLERVDPGPRYTFDYVPVEGILSLDEIAELAGVEVEAVQALNPELRRDRLPPSREPYYIRLPYDTYPTFLENYGQLSDEHKTQTLAHEVRPGETVGQIARRYGVSREALLEANALKTGRIKVGQSLMIPPISYRGNRQLAAATDGQPMHVRYGARFTHPIAPSSDLAMAAPAPSVGR